MPHPTLLCHPASACPQITRFTANLVIAPQRWTLGFLIEGAIEELLIPNRSLPRRANGLWQHTCFEAFVRDGAAIDAYCEFNFSPSGEWAAYRFDSYRQGMTPLTMETPRIEMHSSSEQLAVSVEWMPPAELDHTPRGSAAALTAVIEDRDGRISYWALRHAAHKPDFHRRESFVLQVPPHTAV